jgi:hypothetical protein
MCSRRENVTGDSDSDDDDVAGDDTRVSWLFRAEYIFDTF